MKLGNPVLILLLAGLAALALGCAGRQAKNEPEEVSAQSLFQEKCSECHALNVALKEKHTLFGWQKLVKQEAGRKVWFISSREQDLISRYLFRNYPAEEDPGPRTPIREERIHDRPEDVR